MQETRRTQLLSFEALVGLFVGLFAAVAEVSWELRSLGVLVAALVALNIARRFDGSFVRKVGLAVGAIVLLVFATWRPIWKSFHEDFPGVAGETVLSRIIVFSALCGAALAAYAFLMRPRREGQNLIPAQLMAFGGSLIALGLLAAAIGLLWQFQQNRAMGITIDNGPNLLPAPTIPQITQVPVPQALPPPPSPVASPAPPPPAPPVSAQGQPAPPLMNGYSLTSTGSRVLADEAFKIKGVLPSLTVWLQNNDNSGRALATEIVRAFSIGGIPSTLNFGQLGGPTERGPIILFDDPDKLPEAATRLKATLEKAGMQVTVIKRTVGTFQFFVGPDPNN
jgi:hypothetical protein